MFKRVLSGMVLVSASGATAGQPLQPVGSWVLDYRPTQCIASRKYENAAQPTILAIRQSPNGETYEIRVARNSQVSEPIKEEEGTVDFGRGPIAAWVLFYQTPKRTLDVHQFRIPATDMAQARSANEVTLQIAGSSDFTFTLDSMPQLLDGLQTCTANLKRYWNMDGEKDGTFSRLSRGDLRSIFNPGDYPIEAMKRGQEGKGQYLLLVDEKGKVAGCQVLLATGMPILDAEACAVIETRAKFTPALDKSGKPVRSTVVTPPIYWKFS